jgi:hypothetical protein
LYIGIDFALQASDLFKLSERQTSMTAFSIEQQKRITVLEAETREFKRKLRQAEAATLAADKKANALKVQCAVVGESQTKAVGLLEAVVTEASGTSSNLVSVKAQLERTAKQATNHKVEVGALKRKLSQLQLSSQADALQAEQTFNSVQGTLTRLQSELVKQKQATQHAIDSEARLTLDHARCPVSLYLSLSLARVLSLTAADINSATLKATAMEQAQHIAQQAATLAVQQAAKQAADHAIAHSQIAVHGAAVRTVQTVAELKASHTASQHSSSATFAATIATANRAYLKLRAQTLTFATEAAYARNGFSQMESECCRAVKRCSALQAELRRLKKAGRKGHGRRTAIGGSAAAAAAGQQNAGPISPLVAPRELRAGQSHFDNCMVCDDGGELLCCDTCPKACHLECSGLGTVPGVQWQCSHCVLPPGTAGVAHYHPTVLPGGMTPNILSASPPPPPPLHPFTIPALLIRAVVSCTPCQPAHAIAIAIALSA